MRTVGSNFRNAMPAAAVLPFVAVLASCVVGRSSIPQSPHVEAPPVVAAIPPPASNFMIAAGMLDTWNAIGQLVVRMDGVIYKGRAQMLGIYDVQYRDERFLIVTRALVVNSQGQGMLTKVSVTLQDGKPDASAPAIELLDLLQARLPEELQRIAAGKGKVKGKGESAVIATMRVIRLG